MLKCKKEAFYVGVIKKGFCQVTNPIRYLIESLPMVISLVGGAQHSQKEEMRIRKAFKTNDISVLSVTYI